VGLPADHHVYVLRYLLCSDTFIANYWEYMFAELGVASDDLSGASRAVKERTGIDVVFAEILRRGPNYPVHWAVMRKTGVYD
jgi:hypothetical protein